MSCTTPVHVIARVRGVILRFQVLLFLFFNDLALHPRVFLVICKLTNLRIKIHPLVTSDNGTLSSLSDVLWQAGSSYALYEDPGPIRAEKRLQAARAPNSTLLTELPQYTHLG